MQTISLKTHVGEDSILQISLPANIKNTDLEITLVYQPILEEKKTENKESNQDNYDEFEQIIENCQIKKGVLSKLKEIKIQAPEDFAQNIDLYLNGEK